MPWQRPSRQRGQCRCCCCSHAQTPPTHPRHRGEGRTPPRQSAWPSQPWQPPRRWQPFWVEHRPRLRRRRVSGTKAVSRGTGYLFAKGRHRHRSAHTGRRRCRHRRRRRPTNGGKRRERVLHQTPPPNTSSKSSSGSAEGVAVARGAGGAAGTSVRTATRRGARTLAANPTCDADARGGMPGQATGEAGAGAKPVKGGKAGDGRAPGGQAGEG